MEKQYTLTCGELKIPCKLCAPDQGPIRRIVLGVHGFGGSASDPIQVGIAEEMMLFSSAVLRFDFPAHGESPLGSEMLELPNCVDSLLAAARSAREQFPEVEDLCIFATGFGAYVTLISLQQLVSMPGRVKLVLHTPAVMMHDTVLAMKGISRETLWAMDKVTFQADRPFDVSYRFYEQMRSHIALSSHPIPMLILHSEEDQYIDSAHVHHLRRINEDSKLVIIPGTSHRFLEDGAWDMVLDLTRDWFEFEQVLLTDWE